MHQFDLIQYGKTVKLDLHGLNCQQAKYELFTLLNTVDIDTKAIEIVHGHNSGVILKNMVKEFEHPLIKSKKKIDVSRTLLILNW